MSIQELPIWATINQLSKITGLGTVTLRSAILEANTKPTGPKVQALKMSDKPRAKVQYKTEDVISLIKHREVKYTQKA